MNTVATSLYMFIAIVESFFSCAATVGELDLRRGSRYRIARIVRRVSSARDTNIHLLMCQELERELLLLEKLLGRGKDHIRKHLGNPAKSEVHFDCFSDAGIVVYYKADIATKVIGTQLVDGAVFRGRVLGVGLGDSIEKCLATWGKVGDAVQTPFEYDKMMWHHKGLVLELEIWTKDGEDNSFGKYYKNTVKSIAVSKKPEKP